MSYPRTVNRRCAQTSAGKLSLQSGEKLRRPRWAPRKVCSHVARPRLGGVRLQLDLRQAARVKGATFFPRPLRQDEVQNFPLACVSNVAFGAAVSVYFRRQPSVRLCRLTSESQTLIPFLNEFLDKWLTD